MPEKQEHRTKLNGRVRIKDEVTHMYPSARVYNEGIVRRQIHDELGYPMIFVEWDKDHWAYSGEQDRLLLEAHFDPVEETMADKNEDLAAALTEFLKGWQNKDEESNINKDKDDPRPTEEYSYEHILDNAVKDALDGEAFIVISASSENFQGTDMLAPHVYVHHKSEAARLFLEATIADYVAQSVLRMAQEGIRKGLDGSSSS